MIKIKNEFKTIQFALFFTNLDKKEERVYRFLLPKLLISNTKTYATKALMHRHLEELYGAQLYTKTEKHANFNVMSFMLTIVDPKIVLDDDLVNKAVVLLNDIFIDRKSFNEQIFEEEKRLLIEQWEALKDHKRAYASIEFAKSFYDQDLAAYPLSGTLEDIKKVTLDDMISYYQTSFFNQDIKIVVNGHIDESVDASIANLGVKSNDLNLSPIFEFRDSHQLIKNYEKTQMNQAILKLGYIIPVYRFDPLYEAVLCLDTILGGYPESRLFSEIRENQGLCYDISSNYDYYKGTIVISSGVAKHQKDYALEEIIKVSKSFDHIPVTDEELTHAKAYLSHQIKSSLDHQSYITKRSFFRSIFGDQTTTEQRLKNIMNVSLEDIKKVTSMMTLDTIYVLYGGES